MGTPFFMDDNEFLPEIIVRIPINSAISGPDIIYIFAGITASIFVYRHFKR
jgi:hypothetical protein